MTEDSVQVWLVERTFAGDEQVLELIYATPDGSRYLRKIRTPSSMGPMGDGPPTAAIEVSPDKLVAVDDAETRDQYATEAERMTERHEPDDAV